MNEKMRIVMDRGGHFIEDDYHFVIFNESRTKIATLVLEEYNSSVVLSGSKYGQSMSANEVKALMTELWACGVRPDQHRDEVQMRKEDLAKIQILQQYICDLRKALYFMIESQEEQT